MAQEIAGEKPEGARREPNRQRQALWITLREKVVPLALMAFAAACIAGVPLQHSTQWQTAEHEIGNIQWEILQLQEEKANLSKERSEKMTLDALVAAGTRMGLGAPRHVEFVDVPASNEVPTTSP
jgi:cell division protein FtsL